MTRLRQAAQVPAATAAMPVRINPQRLKGQLW